MSQRYNKRQLELARRERAARKKQRRIDLAAAEPDPVESPVLDESATLDALSRLHESFEAGSIGFDEFEATKHELIAQLRVD